ncbi:unnamed protein product [Miscanthus lutarioriparius]|uniref:Uncharacterized protein n=1 Tax=Miscanthus lutarioriparius TaxID=422564 RepID=A0A811Q6C3_9POAL|nr:unnamed protein product [Miscanthus lutarioriparius]
MRSSHRRPRSLDMSGHGAGTKAKAQQRCSSSHGFREYLELEFHNHIYHVQACSRAVLLDNRIFSTLSNVIQSVNVELGSMDFAPILPLLCILYDNFSAAALSIVPEC